MAGHLFVFEQGKNGEKVKKGAVEEWRLAAKTIINGQKMEKPTCAEKVAFGTAKLPIN